MSTATKIALQIVTPSGVVLERSVEELTAPSVEGQFGVLPGHRPLVAALRTGLVTLRVGTEEERFAVGDGFVEVFEDRAVLLTDLFSTQDGFDPVQVRLDMKEATGVLEHSTLEELGQDEFRRTVSRQLWAAALLELHGDPPAAVYGGRLEPTAGSNLLPEPSTSSDESH
jgi:F-type H+-transporting ATPase subunit epsilon